MMRVTALFCAGCGVCAELDENGRAYRGKKIAIPCERCGHEVFFVTVQENGKMLMDGKLVSIDGTMAVRMRATGEPERDPPADFAEWTNAFLRNVGESLGLSYEEMTADYEAAEKIRAQAKALRVAVERPCERLRRRGIDPWALTLRLVDP